jgi:hypothetical protein
MSDDRVERILAVRRAAQALADPHGEHSARARAELVQETGLSPQGVALALEQCLEHQVSRATLSGLVKVQPLLSRSHVLLSANVFTAAFRAVVLGLCQSPQTQVRASRRSSAFPRLLWELSGGAFDLVDALVPQSGESLWAYGTAETLSSLRTQLPSGVQFHAHGPGMGVAVFRQPVHYDDPELPTHIAGLVSDVIAFDQRGCLSPRLVLVEGTRSYAEQVCDLLVRTLDEAERAVPRGQLDPQETADALRYEATVTYLGSSAPAGMGMVFLDPVPQRVLTPPVGRYLHVSVCSDAASTLVTLGPELTGVGIYNGQDLPGRLQERIGPRRYVALGQMQRPAFDGPVDLRSGFAHTKRTSPGM